ncbi:MAG: M48 family metallopeptidase [Cyanobacteria bacterium P01_G01_bin.19]
MKLIGLGLISLNIFLLLPATALAEESSLAKYLGDRPVLLAQADEIDEDDQTEETEKKEETEETDKVKEPTPEEIARLKQLANADQLYLSGYKAEARKLYRQAKEVWEQEKQTTKQDESIAPFSDPEQLSYGGKVFWRNYQRGKEQNLESKVITALKLLTTREPEFIPGHVYYANVLRQYGRQAEAAKTLDWAVGRYPGEVELVKARMEHHVVDEEWLEASILARQFVLFNPDSSQAKELEQEADIHLAKYQSELRSDITLNAIGNAIAGTVGFVLTGNPSGPFSAFETTSAILQGESAIGRAGASQAKKQLPLLEDPEVLEYVNDIGQKVASHAGRDDFDYEFYVIMDDNLNAFALPGGKIFINAGAIMQTDSEAELAGLLAHEVSHSALSHGFQLVTQGNLTANIVRYIPYVGNVATSLIVMNYSRDMEKQADIYGTRILVNSGYAADGVRNLMVKLRESHQHDEENAEPPEWFSTHPNSKQRVKYIEQLIVDRNLNRFAYEGVARHQNIKYLVEDKWQEYAKCIEDIATLEEAKECARGKIKAESKIEGEIKNQELEGDADQNPPKIDRENE